MLSFNSCEFELSFKLHAMGFLTHESKARIVRLHTKGKGPSEIVRILAEDDVKISCWSIPYLPVYNAHPYFGLHFKKKEKKKQKTEEVVTKE